MATFARTGFNATAYSAFRPTWPPQLFEAVYTYHATGHAEWRRCVDLGCGTGQATTVLAERFEEAIGVDPSPPMIDRAKQALSEPSAPKNVRYVISPAEELGFLEDESVDLVTASQAAHWFDYDKLWPELGRVLKPNGTTAFFNYAEMRLPKHPKLNRLITEYSQGPNSLGPYWQQPGRSINENLLNAIPDPGAPFSPSSLQRIHHAGTYFPRSESPDPQPVMLKKHLTWEGFEQYLKTWSSLHTYLEQHPEDREKEGGDISARFMKKLKKDVMEDGGNEEGIDVEWPSALILVKKAA